MSHGDPRLIRAAAAIRRSADKAVAKKGGQLRQAEVMGTDPLSARLIDTTNPGSALFLTDDDLLLSAQVRMYDLYWTIETGDTLILQQQPNDQFLVVGVLSPKDLNPVHAPIAEEHTLHTDHGQVVGRIDAYTEDGTPLGVILIYDPDTLTPSPD